jgi:N-acetylmuramoyl-L-alanine amidase
MTAASPLAYQTVRLSGNDRVETALSIAEEGWDSANTVILCEYSDYADSIASTPYAASLNAPLLLTGGDSLDPRVADELQHLETQKVILLGGRGCLKPSIEKELASLSLKWERIGGADRYETSILLAKRLDSDSLILANGDDFPDALSAAAYAGIKQIPIVLTSRIMPTSVSNYCQESQPHHLFVIGGEGVVPTQNLTENKLTIEKRLGGRDRYETNAQVISFMKDICTSKNLFLASGLTFPDAVAGTVLASNMTAPLLLTEKEDIPSAVYSLLRAHMVVEPPAPGTAATADTVYTVPVKGTIAAAGGLNLRDLPTTTGGILTIVPNGTTVELNAKQGLWYKTTYQGQTGWIYADYVALVSADKIFSASTVDLSDNGTVYILGGPGVISTNTQNIIEGKAASAYTENLKTFPPLPATLKTPEPAPASPPSRGNDPSPVSPEPSPVNTEPEPPESAYDPAKEVPLDPYQGIPDKALAGKTIVVDPGHGGKDPGAPGPSNTYEKNINLAIALALNEVLKTAGAEVVLTRSSDACPAGVYTQAADLEARVNIANQTNADLFVSIHNNAALDSQLQGTSVYVSGDNSLPAESLQLAYKLQAALTTALSTNNLGVRKANFYVIKYTNMPAALIETAFISNPYEEARLQNPVFRKNVAAAIFQGIYNYYKSPATK